MVSLGPLFAPIVVALAAIAMVACSDIGVEPPAPTPGQTEGSVADPPSKESPAPETLENEVFVADARPIQSPAGNDEPSDVSTVHVLPAPAPSPAAQGPEPVPVVVELNAQGHEVVKEVVRDVLVERSAAPVTALGHAPSPTSPAPHAPHSYSRSRPVKWCKSASSC